MKKRRPAYKSSIALSIATSLVILLTVLFITRPSLAKKIQHRVYRGDPSSPSLVLDPTGEKQAASPDSKVYQLAQVLSGQTEIEWVPTLLLVSPRHPLPDNYQPDLLTDSYTSLEMASPLAPAFTQLSQAVNQEFEEKLYISSLYRTAQDQEEVYAEDPSLAMPPGESEHQTGLAVDVYVFQFAGPNFINAPAGRWVNENAWRYGFVVRYPQGQEDITGMSFEPWHLRYVGQPHAEILTAHGWVLEEYLGHLEADKIYRFGDYCILRTSQPEFHLPADLQDLKISPDNLGSYVIWGQYSK